jgi:hypothetical protein
MSNTHRRPEGRRHQVPGFQEPAWGLLALWAGVATMAGAASAHAAPMVAFGPGAAVLAGAGVASAAVVALVAGSRVRAAVSSAPTIPSALPPAPPMAVLGTDPIMAELFGGLAAQVASLEERIAGARPPAAPPEAGGPGGQDAAIQAQARRVERLEREQQAMRDGMAAAGPETDRRTGLRLDALAGALQSRLDGLDDELALLRRGLDEAEARSRDAERRVFDVLRARDARKALRQIDAEASDLFDKLFYCEERSYGSKDAWRADYAGWRSRIKAFWDIVRGYVASVDQPFAVCDSDIERAGGVPEIALFEAPDMRVRFKMLVVINERHIQFRDDAFLFNARKGSPPECAAAQTLWSGGEHDARTAH